MRPLAPLVLLLLAACAGRPVAGGPSAIRIVSAVPDSSVPVALAAGDRWALPTCPLRYEIVTTEKFEPAGGSATELVTFMTVDAKTSGSGLELRITPTTAIKNGKYRPYALPDPGFPALVLATDGARWHPVHDSAMLFAGLGSQGGLAWLFPDLPEAGKTSWDLLVDERTLNQNGVWFANSRGVTSLKEGKTVVWPLHQEASWSDGRVVVHARGPERWSSRSGPDDFAVLDREGEIRTEHVILPRGRLLRAHLERDVELAFTVQEREPTHARIVQRSDAHLVSACDGQTEPRLEPVLSREERAIAVVGDLGVALDAAKRPASTIDAFSRTLRRAHKDEAILQTIDRYRKDRGDTWWPLPVVVEDGDLASKSDRVELSASTIVKSPRLPNAVTPVRFRFEIVEEDGRLVLDRVSAAFELEPGRARLLEITKERLFP